MLMQKAAPIWEVVQERRMGQEGVTSRSIPICSIYDVDYENSFLLSATIHLQPSI